MARIAIIGGGCSGTLVTQALSRMGGQAGISEVLLFDESGGFGPGLPYGRDTNDGEFILNMASSLLSASAGQPDGFDRWLQQVCAGQAEVSGGYVRRSLMGAYLQDVAAQAESAFAARGVKLVRVAQAVTDIDRGASGFHVATAQHAWHVDQVVLALGHLKKRSPFPGVAHYHANPYHDLGAIKAELPHNASIGILGTKLTGIDMALLLGRLGVKRIHMFSHSGQLPLVRGALPTTAPVRPEQRYAGDTLRGFLRWFRESHPCGHEYPGLMTIRDPLVRIGREIEAAHAVRDWQLQLDATKEDIDRCWAALRPDQKRRFFRKYQGLWMSYRHPMPLDNARKIQALLQAGRLSVHPGYRATRLAEGRPGFQVELAGGTLALGGILDATGVAGNLARIDSPLIENLIDCGLVRQHELGGIAIDAQSLQVLGQPGLFAIGALTQGALFYVSAVERLLLHAQHIAGQLGRFPNPSSAGAREALPHADRVAV